MKKLLLIDGNSMLFRAYYGTLSRGLMKSKEGVVTNAVFGFSTMLTKAMEIINPDFVMVAFDTKDQTFRHKMFDDYKGTRKDVDPELVSQFALIREFLDAYPIPRFELSGYEADDIIGTLSKAFPEIKSEILTSDRDMLQLIDDNVDVLLMKKGLTELKVMDKATLFEETGLTPSQIVDVKALQGDTSDNIPGVPSIGEKTAIKLITQYETLENLYNHKDEVKGKMGENLRAFEEQARLSYKLAEIYTDVENTITLEEITYNKPDTSLNAFYRKYDMTSLIFEESNDTVPTEIETFEITDFDETWIENTEIILTDTDKKSEVQGVYLYNGTQYSYLTKPEMIMDLNFHKLLSRDKQLLSVSSKDFYRFCFDNAISVTQTFDDVLLLAFITNPAITTLDILKDHHDLWFTQFEGLDNGFKLMKEALKLFSNLKEKAIEDDVYDVYTRIEKPLTPVLAHCEYLGINVDRSVLDDIAQTTEIKLEALSETIYGFVKEPFNINSPKQLAEILFDELGLPGGKKRSTAVDVLESLKDKHPIIESILEFRKYQKLYSTYATGLTKHIKEDGRIHTQFNQHATQTGRLSSSNPNMQNISVRDEETRAVRKAFIASKGRKLVSIDYSQIELRVLAYLAQEEKMIEAFKNGEDIHASTAMQIFGVDTVDSKMRRQAKSVNFGIVYGISSFGLANQLDIGFSEAQDFIDRYNAVYPNISKYMQTIVEECKEDGFVTTFFNRRRYIPEIYDKNRAVSEFAKRAAMNAPIQGTAADIIKLAMVQSEAYLSSGNFKSEMLLQVHDELVFDVVEEELDTLIEGIQKIMENVVNWEVPMQVSVSVGDNWMEGK